MCYKSGVFELWDSLVCQTLSLLFVYEQIFLSGVVSRTPSAKHHQWRVPVFTTTHWQYFITTLGNVWYLAWLASGLLWPLLDMCPQWCHNFILTYITVMTQDIIHMTQDIIYLLFMTFYFIFSCKYENSMFDTIHWQQLA